MSGVLFEQIDCTAFLFSSKHYINLMLSLAGWNWNFGHDHFSVDELILHANKQVKAHLFAISLVYIMRRNLLRIFLVQKNVLRH